MRLPIDLTKPHGRQVLVQFFSRLPDRRLSPERFYGPVAGGCRCDECSALAEPVGKRWTDVPVKLIDFHSGSPPLMQPQALVAFLPA
jgi:hypothetical protein